jgi:hypothetical protein
MAVTTDHKVGQTQKFYKMKTLGKLKLKEEKMLSHEELLGFRGGAGSGQCYTCACKDGTGVWTGCYNDSGDLAVRRYCYPGGGYGFRN